MTPVSPQLGTSYELISRMVRASLGGLLLAALFLPARDPGTHGFTIEWRPSAELAGVLFLVAVASSARPRLAAARGPALALAALVVAAALLNLAGAATPSLLGRDLNLYWDLRHLPSLLGLARESAGLWSASVAAALFFVGVGFLTGA